MIEIAKTVNIIASHLLQIFNYIFETLAFKRFILFIAEKTKSLDEKYTSYIDLPEYSKSIKLEKELYLKEIQLSPENMKNIVAISSFMQKTINRMLSYSSTKKRHKENNKIFLLQEIDMQLVENAMSNIESSIGSMKSLNSKLISNTFPLGDLLEFFLSTKKTLASVDFVCKNYINKEYVTKQYCLKSLCKGKKLPSKRKKEKIRLSKNLKVFDTCYDHIYSNLSQIIRGIKSTLVGDANEEYIIKLITTSYQSALSIKKNTDLSKEGGNIMDNEKIPKDDHNQYSCR